MIFPLLKTWFRPLCGSVLRSSQKTYKTPTGFRTIGGGGGESSGRNRRGPPSANPITANLTFTESEEQMMNDVKLQSLKAYVVPGSGNHLTNGIVVSNEIAVTTEDRSSHPGEQYPQRVHETW